MKPPSILDRRRLMLGSAGLGLLGLGGCAATAAGVPAPAPSAVPYADQRPPIRPLHARMDRVFDITVCLRRSIVTISSMSQPIRSWIDLPA